MGFRSFDVFYAIDNRLLTFSEYSEYVKNSEKLCDLNPFTFEAGNIPDYSNIHINSFICCDMRSPMLLNTKGCIQNTQKIKY